MLGNTFREYLARKRPFYHPSPSENTFERYLAMILGCLCVQDAHFIPMPIWCPARGLTSRAFVRRPVWNLSKQESGPVSNIALLAIKQRPISWTQEMGRCSATTQGPYLLQTPCILGCSCRLKHARDSGMQVPGVSERLSVSSMPACWVAVGSGRVGVLAWPSARRRTLRAVGSGRAGVLV